MRKQNLSSLIYQSCYKSYILYMVADLFFKTKFREVTGSNDCSAWLYNIQLILIINPTVQPPFDWNSLSSWYSLMLHCKMKRRADLKLPKPRWDIQEVFAKCEVHRKTRVTVSSLEELYFWQTVILNTHLFLFNIHFIF